MKKTLSLLLTLSAALTLNAAEAASVRGADGVTVNINNPKRVVALNGTTVEIIYKLGKQNTLVGRDVTGTFPAAAERLPSVGHWAQVGAEGVISLKPDLVIATEDSFIHDNAALKTQLRAAGVPLLVLPEAGKGGTGGFRTRVNMIAQAYGAQNQANVLMRNFVGGLATARAAKPTTAPRVMFLYAHGANDASIYGRDNGADNLISLAGGRNVANFAGTQKLTAEGVVRLNPDAIIMLNRGWDAIGGQAGLLKMPGVAQTKAGKNRRFYRVDDSVRWIGPRLPEFATKLAREWKADFR